MTNPFKRRYRILKLDTLGEVWYEVQEWNWYWPVWTHWTLPINEGFVVKTRFGTEYEAERAIRFRNTKANARIETTVVRQL